VNTNQIINITAQTLMGVYFMKIVETYGPDRSKHEGKLEKFEYRPVALTS